MANEFIARKGLIVLGPTSFVGETQFTGSINFQGNVFESTSSITGKFDFNFGGSQYKSYLISNQSSHMTMSYSNQITGSYGTLHLEVVGTSPNVHLNFSGSNIKLIARDAPSKYYFLETGSYEITSVFNGHNHIVSVSDVAL